MHIHTEINCSLVLYYKNILNYIFIAKKNYNITNNENVLLNKYAYYSCFLFSNLHLRFYF